MAGSGVYLKGSQMSLVNALLAGKYSKLINNMLDMFFTRDILANSSASGEGKFAPLDCYIVQAIKGGSFSIWHFVTISAIYQD